MEDLAGRRWDALAVLAVVALVAGPFVAPVMAPALGVSFVRASGTWGARAKRWGTAAGLAPVLAIAGLVLYVFLYPWHDLSQVAAAALVAMAAWAVPVAGGVALALAARRAGAVRRGGRVALR